MQDDTLDAPNLRLTSGFSALPVRLVQIAMENANRSMSTIN